MLSLYEEFTSAARLEKSITNQAIEIVQLKGGNYHSQGLSVEITGSSIEIKLDQEFVFKLNQGKVQRPDDLSLLSNLELQLQGTLKDLNQVLSTQRHLEQARLEAEQLKAQRENASTRSASTQDKERGYGLTM